jgi:hypothetical protein
LSAGPSTDTVALGHRIWIFPDGDLPPRDPYDPELKNGKTYGHESLILLNTGPQTSHPVLHVYFEDKEPWVVSLPPIPARRVACYRTDEPLGAEKIVIPQGQYALVLESDVPVVAQLGRMDVRQPNLAYYTVMGFPAPG